MRDEHGLSSCRPHAHALLSASRKVASEAVTGSGERQVARI